jgi:hypothetical protein
MMSCEMYMCYYTPKPIVSFMCREALKGYLESKAATESKQAIERFVDKHEPADLKDAEHVLDALRTVKVCDPACGSGAYLLGMLHELLDLRAALFQTRKLDAKSVYDRKLEIIQSNIYGVDLDQFAVNIARLRLWLSLAVDYEGLKPEPLPNLDYKVEVGDSLLGPNPSGGLEMGFRKQLVEELLSAKAEFLTAHHSHKRDLKTRVEKLRADVSSFSGHRSISGFDWVVEFAEVFVNGGFDVIVANPPYVRQELISSIKPALKQAFGTFYSGTADLYCYFYARAVELLHSGGKLSFISSNKWLKAAYGTNLRKLLGSESQIRSITDFGELPVFETAATFPMILVAKKKGASNASTSAVYTQVKSLNDPYPDVRAIVTAHGFVLSNDACTGSEWSLSDSATTSFLNQVATGSIPLRDYVEGAIYRGIVTGLNEAFIIDGVTRSNQIHSFEDSTVDHITPYSKGGKTVPANAQLAHRACNARKNAQMPVPLSAAAGN